MAYNGSGLFTNPFNWNNDKANSVLITASRMQTQDDQIATGLSSVIVKDGQQITTARIPFAVGISINAGLVGTPSVAVAGDLTTGIYQSTAGAIDFTSLGTRVGGFTAAGLTNTAISGGAGSFTTLIASGNFAINTNKFTVNASTGNTIVAGTLGVTGAATLASASITGAATVGTTLGVTGNLAVNTNKFNITASSGAFSAAGAGTIGANGGTGGSLVLAGSSSGSSTIRVATSAGSATIFQVPNNNGTNGYNLVTNGSGVTSWSAPSVGIFTQSFTSTDQTITSGGALTIPHGLSTAPLIVHGFLVCQSSDAGFSAGNVVPCHIFGSTVANADVATPLVMTIDATNISVRYSSNGNCFGGTMNFSDGSTGNYDNTKWKLRLRAYA